MKLELYDEDLLSRFKMLGASSVRFKHFKKSAQRAVRAAGQALYRGPRGDTHAAIYPVTPKPKSK